jgi:zinc transport system ATP-binding protein
MTILMISHDLRAAARDASHILHLANRQLFFGEKEAYLNTDIGRLYALLEATA